MYKGPHPSHHHLSMTNCKISIFEILSAEGNSPQSPQYHDHHQRHFSFTEANSSYSPQYHHHHGNFSSTEGGAGGRWAHEEAGVQLQGGRDWQVG